MKTKPFIIGFLAIVALLAAVSIYFSAIVDRADKTVAALASPDGKFKAVRITFVAGGAAPFCFDNVSVMFAAYPDEFAQREKAYEVYAAPCGSFANREPSPKLEWLSGSELKIAHAARPAASNVKPMRTKNIDVTKSVHVTFVERE